VMIFFGVLGYFFRKFGYEAAPLIMAFILGPMMENSLRQSLLMSQGDFSIFFTRIISVVCLGLSLLLLFSSLFLRKPRQIISKLS
jgi:putative tricarboxylic transport membrane protein